MVHFALTIFISAFLLFQVQPLIAKSILPWFGGGSSVWTTCMLFFQIVLVGGYGYAHLLTVKLSPRRQGLVHMVLLLLSLALLPIVPSPRFKPDSSDAPVMAILWLLAATVGGPYFMLSSTGPLMQRWFSRLFVGRSPYRLYSLSNVGSLLALLSYPFVIEPTLRLRWQTGIWSILYAIFAALAVSCSLRMLKLSDKPVEPVRAKGESEMESDDAVVRPGVSRMLLWLGLSALGSAMLLATTNQMCIDVAVFPFLWVLPLSLYLLSFIICFDSPRWYDRRVFGLLLVPAVVAACWQLNQKLDTSIPVIIGIYSSVMFVCCMTCHGELVSARPHPRYLTLFYLLVSVGGAIGGAFVAILSPLVFKGFWEYHVALAGACGVTLMAWILHRVWQGSCAVTFWIGALVSAAQIWLVIALVVRQVHPALAQIELEMLLGVIAALHAIGWVLTARLQSKGAWLVWSGVTVVQLIWIVGWMQTQFTGTLESRQLVLLSVACGAVVGGGVLAARAVDRRLSETLRRWLLIAGLQCIVAIGLWLLWKENVVSHKTLTQCMIGLIGIYLMGLCWGYFKSGVFARGGVWFWGPAVLGWVLLLMILTQYMRQDRTSFVHVSRNFYGVLKVTSESDHNGDYYSLMNGQIEHGTQYLDDYWKKQPTTYYGQTSAVDLAMKYHPRRLAADPKNRSLKVGVVGLGAGTIAAYGQSADIFRFYEINRSVIEIATQYFTYLKDSPAKTELVLGDARMALEREWSTGGSQQFDVLAIDAFSSDAIPLHLLTRECSELYRQHLAPDGLLLIHISNRYLDLNPITLALAEHLGWKAVRIESDDNLELGIHTATWVIVTDNKEFLAQSEIQQAHSPWEEDQTKLLWTDDFASLWQVITY